jgi:glutaredoxin
MMNKVSDREVHNMSIEHVKGKNAGSIMLYALSTCGWCRKTKALLTQLGVDYSYTDVDLLEGAEKENVMNIVRKWNPSCSFPTLVINNKCIVGFQEDAIRGAVNS